MIEIIKKVLKRKKMITLVKETDKNIDFDKIKENMITFDFLEALQRKDTDIYREVKNNLENLGYPVYEALVKISKGPISIESIHADKIVKSFRKGIVK